MFFEGPATLLLVEAYMLQTTAIEGTTYTYICSK